MSINATLLAQMIVFALLVWFTMEFVWPLLLQAMEDRETRIADGLAAAEEGQRKLEQAASESSKVLEEKKAEAQEIVVKAQRRADEMVEAAKDDARAEGERLLQAARAEIEQEKNQARSELRGQVAALAVAGAEQILAREVDAAAHDTVLKQLSESL